MFVLELS